MTNLMVPWSQSREREAHLSPWFSLAASLEVHLKHFSEVQDFEKKPIISNVKTRVLTEKAICLHTLVIAYMIGLDARPNLQLLLADHQHNWQTEKEQDLLGLKISWWLSDWSNHQNVWPRKRQHRRFSDAFQQEIRTWKGNKMKLYGS